MAAAGGDGRLRAVLAHLTAAGPSDTPPSHLPTPPKPADFADPDKGTLDTPLGHNRWFYFGEAQGPYAGFADGRPEMDVGRLVAAVRQEGFVLIRNAMPVAWVDECARAFSPRLQSHIARIGADDPETRNRGPFRHYVDIPACQPFVGITAVDVAMAVVRELLGGEVAMAGLASDTPLARAGGQGSVYQGIHWCAPSLRTPAAAHSPRRSDPGRLLCRDGTGLNDLDVPPECYLNWPLCDIDDRNGPFEMAAGTHRLVGQCRADQGPFFPELEHAHRRIVDGSMPLRRLLMRKGDLMIRDPRCLHRASPNLTTADRPMMVIFFLASAERAASFSHRCPGMTRDTWRSLSGAQQRLLRAIPVVGEEGAHAALGSNGYELF